MNIKFYFVSFVMLFTLLGCTLPTGNQQPMTHVNSSTFPLVVAADRGYLGNELLRDVLTDAGLTSEHLLIVGDKNYAKRIANKVEKITRQSTGKFLVLPYFLSPNDPLWKKSEKELTRILCSRSLCENISIERPIGSRYFTQHSLWQTLRQVPNNKPLIVLAAGANTDSEAESIASSIGPMIKRTAQLTGHTINDIIVWRNGYDRFSHQTQQLKKLAEENDANILPFHLGRKLDSMMGLNAYLKYSLSNRLIDVEPLTTESSSAWIQSQVNRHSPITKQSLGVIFLAHGSDIEWNDTMRDAAHALTTHYDTEFVFSMADQLTLERAVRNMEKRGKSHVVILRVFGQSSSFEQSIKHMFGLNKNKRTKHQHSMMANHSTAKDHSSSSDHSTSSDHSSTDAHAGHGHPSSAVGSPYIITHLHVTTVGGLDDHEFFAEAMLSRGLELSQNPGKELLILAAHGKGDDHQNHLWQENLKRIVDKMKAEGGQSFHAIEYVTWREDWEDKKQSAIDKMDELFAYAKDNDLEVLIVPARTTGQGPAKQLLKDKSFKLGWGFAPHPKFTQWVLAMVEQGIVELSAESENS